MLRFREFLLDPATGELSRRDGSHVRLEPQPSRVLVALASRAGSLVTRDELRAAIWPAGTHVEFDQGLNYCIRQVRAALGDDARRPIYIETCARRGYRFLPQVEDVPPFWRRRVVRLAGAAAGILLSLWVVERLEGPGDGAAHHDMAVGLLKVLHDLVF